MRAPLDQILVSAVLPVYNEAGVLRELARRVDESVSTAGARREIIFVNDGSTDGSTELLDLLARERPNVRVVHLSRNFGHQAAVQAGLEHARGDVVLLMDSDLQDAPEAIGRFLAEWQKGYDVVYAVRAQRKEGLWKRCLFAGFHRFLSTISSMKIPPNAGNFSLMDRRVVDQIIALSERDRYLPGLRCWVGFRQTGIVVRRNARYDGRPRVSLAALWRLAKTAIFSFSTFPLALFYVIGYLALAIFLTFGAYCLLSKTFATLDLPVWTTSVLVASFFGALNALGISMLGEYVVRIYDQVRSRPLYVVSRTTSGETAAPDDQYTAVLEQAEELLAASSAARHDEQPQHPAAPLAAAPLVSAPLTIGR